VVIYQELLYDDPVKSCADFLSSLSLLPQFLPSSPLPSPNLEDVESTQSAISKLFLTRPRTETYSTKTSSIRFSRLRIRTLLSLYRLIPRTSFPRPSPTHSFTSPLPQTRTRHSRIRQRVDDPRFTGSSLCTRSSVPPKIPIRRWSTTTCTSTRNSRSVRRTTVGRETVGFTFLEIRFQSFHSLFPIPRRLPSNFLQSQTTTFRLLFRAEEYFE